MEKREPQTLREARAEIERRRALKREAMRRYRAKLKARAEAEKGYGPEYGDPKF